MGCWYRSNSIRLEFVPEFKFFEFGHAREHTTHIRHITRIPIADVKCCEATGTSEHVSHSCHATRIPFAYI